ncbi:MAG: MBL fold metallo-hydrolase [Alphaproteobacteria bacterium]|nr:MBL fold metallo-hydrolase [Alphaproteobacteria bacterium]
MIPHLAALCLSVLSSSAHATDPDANSVTEQTSAGPFVVHAVQHGTARIEFGGKTIWLDPWSQAPLGDAPAKADVLLITDIHPDHLDPAAIDKVHTAQTVTVAPAAVRDAWQGGDVDHVLANGQTVEVAGMKITAVPMYNLHRGPEPGKLFHDKGRGNGYLIEVGGKRIYFAGDTACTDELKGLKDVDLAFVPMNLPYTMPPEEAAPCVAAMKPKRVVPYHYRGSDLSVFEQGLEGSGVDVVRLEWYPSQD